MELLQNETVASIVGLVCVCGVIGIIWYLRYKSDDFNN